MRIDRRKLLRRLRKEVTGTQEVKVSLGNIAWHPPSKIKQKDIFHN